MKRNTYVDNQGNPIDHSFESKKTILNIFFLIGTIVPIILIGVIIFIAFGNSKCNNMYTEIKRTAFNYLKEEGKLPDVEGEDVTVSLGKLYNEKYLSTVKTDNMTCSGNVKVTRYRSDYVYTMNLTNCNSCTTSKRYGGWSDELSYMPNKPIIDVVPYYNYYERQVVTTDWSDYYDKEELSKEESKYGVKLPVDETRLPAVPEEGNIVEAQKEEIYYYRYKDKKWKWYDIVGNYSDYSSEQPSGFANKDESTRIYTEWSEYSLTYPEKKEYREISEVYGYQFYYEKDGKKIYANNKNYTAPDDVDQEKYNMREDKSVPMYRYRDSEWRWYNGEKRQYSGYSSQKPSYYNYRDEETMMETDYSSWDAESTLNNVNQSYRIEEKKIMTRFRYVYEILSDPVFEKPLTKSQFVDRVDMIVPDFVTLDEYKVDVSYKFKYRKR